MLLDKKVALITGASRGIGRSIAQRFAEEGALIYANARTEGCLDTFVQNMFNEHNAIVRPVYFDVTDTSAAKKCIMDIRKEEGRLDVLVNNAGIMQDALIGMITSEMIHKTFEVNVFAVMELTQLAARVMIKQGFGSIINMASIVGERGYKGQLVYSASKGAVTALTKSAAKELSGYNVRVNAVAPGMVDTDMFKSIGTKKIEESIRGISAGRLGTPNEVADACVFLASDLSVYIQGQILGIDGAAIV